MGPPITRSGCVTVSFLFIPSFNTFFGYQGLDRHWGLKTLSNTEPVPSWKKLLCEQGKDWPIEWGWVWKGRCKSSRGDRVACPASGSARASQGGVRGPEIWKTSCNELAQGELRRIKSIPCKENCMIGGSRASWGDWKVSAAGTESQNQCDMKLRNVLPSWAEGGRTTLWFSYLAILVIKTNLGGTERVDADPPVRRAFAINQERDYHSS